MWNRNLAAPARALLIGAALLAILPAAAEAEEVIHVTWDNLSMVSHHTVRIFLPGAVVTGKAIGVEADALLVDVKQTNNPKAYPKGTVRVPREKLQTLAMQTKGKRYRVGFTALGAWLGLGGGTAVATLAIQGCGVFSGCRNDHPVAAGFAFAGIAAAGIAGGYMAGNALDKHWTTVEIVPSAAKGLSSR
jgi:hypothetical protein